MHGSSRSGTRDRYRRPGLAVDGALRPGRQRAFLGQTDLEMLVVLGGRQPQPDTDFAALVHGQHVHLLGVRRIYSEQVRLVRNSAIAMASLISPIDLVFAISKIIAENRLEQSLTTG
jgi:hypothetical protein